MYQHLLVPIDESPLSAANLASAVRLAQALGAKITFFHATADLGATDDGALLRVIEPEQFDELARGETDSLLCKAMVAARHAGVKCRAVARIADQPAQAIVEAADEAGCDLIVMASHGARGVSRWLHGSQTERVLRQSSIALLVTRVESNAPLLASERALGVIQDEHRSLAVVIQAMKQIVGALPEGPRMADLPTLAAMVGYLREFPQRLHHPKEELHLHPRLRERVPDSRATLAEIEAQHGREADLVAAVDAAMAAMRSGDEGAASELARAVRSLCQAVRDHIAFEERVILPMAAQHLSEEDWKGVADAFAQNDDPHFGDMTTEAFRRLFAQLATAATAGAAGVETP